jgi:hypothetical protein
MDSSIVPIPLDKLQRLSKDALISHTLNIQGQVRALEYALQSARASQQSANSHCTLALRMIKDTKTCLDNANKRHQHRSAKKNGQIVVAPDLETEFVEEEKQAAAQEKEEKEKEQVKITEAAERDR